jgi:hypothetical protein
VSVEIGLVCALGDRNVLAHDAVAQARFGGYFEGAGDNGGDAVGGAVKARAALLARLTIPQVARPLPDAVGVTPGHYGLPLH